MSCSDFSSTTNALNICSNETGTSTSELTKCSSDTQLFFANLTIFESSIFRSYKHLATSVNEIHAPSNHFIFSLSLNHAYPAISSVIFAVEISRERNKASTRVVQSLSTTSKIIATISLFATHCLASSITIASISRPSSLRDKAFFARLNISKANRLSYLSLETFFVSEHEVIAFSSATSVFSG